MSDQVASTTRRRGVANEVRTYARDRAQLLRRLEAQPPNLQSADLLQQMTGIAQGLSGAAPTTPLADFASLAAPLDSPTMARLRGEAAAAALAAADAEAAADRATAEAHQKATEASSAIAALQAQVSQLVPATPAPTQVALCLKDKGTPDEENSRDRENSPAPSGKRSKPY